ncbi:MAG: polymer-forming cytoskeletal protein [Chthoniobacterales bacterium]
MNLNNLTSSSMAETTNSKNLLANDVEIKGSIKFGTELIFDGKIEGEVISTDGILTIGKNAEIRGEVKTKAVTVFGTVVGNITVTERCELKASSQLTGDLKAMRITIEEGATFVGKSEVTPNRSALQKAVDSGRSTSAPATSSGTPSGDAARKTQPVVS